MSGPDRTIHGGRPPIGELSATLSYRPSARSLLSVFDRFVGLSAPVDRRGDPTGRRDVVVRGLQPRGPDDHVG